MCKALGLISNPKRRKKKVNKFPVFDNVLFLWNAYSTLTPTKPLGNQNISVFTYMNDVVAQAYNLITISEAKAGLLPRIPSHPGMRLSQK